MRTNQHAGTEEQITHDGTTTCPSCGEEVDQDELLDEDQCPECGSPKTELFELAAGVRDQTNGVSRRIDGP